MSLRFLHLSCRLRRPTVDDERARRRHRGAAPFVVLPLVVGALMLAAAAVSVPAAAQAAELLLRAGDTSVPAGTIVYGDAIAVGGRLDVAGTVTGNAIAAGGSVHVSGHVGGNVRAIGGDAVLDSTAVVGGAVRAAGGRVSIAPGAVVHQGGAAPSPPPFPVQPEPRPIPSPFPPVWIPPLVLGIIATWKLLAGLLLLLSFAAFVGTAWLTAVLFPGLTASVAGVLERNPGGAGIAGILVWLLFGPIIVLLVLSIAGILLVLLLIAALLVAIQLGISAVAVLVGHRVRPGHIAVEALTGAVLLAIAFAVPHLGWLAGAVATTWGTGGVVMAIVERRRNQGTIPPPAPSAPLSQGPSSPASVAPPPAGSPPPSV
jgi:hypothetical protein